MATTFHGPSPWPHITAALKAAGPRYAAIAYLDADAPTLLPLRAGDVLVVNAARAALRAHATSPAALAHYVRAGVRVLSTPNLHANVLVTSRRAIVGSAGASESSTIADEAVLVTDDPDAIAEARRFIDGLDEITEVDQTFLDNANAIWQIGRIVPLPGIGGRVRAEPEFLPTPVTRMFLWHITDYQPSADELQERDTHTARRRSAAGPATRYVLEWFRLDTPGGRRGGRLERGDVLLQVTADDHWLHPPAVVDSDAIPVPHSRKAVAYLLRTRVDLEPIAISDAESRLADLGHTHPRLRTDHRVVSAGLRAALLRLWNL
ncbi:phosphatidylserine/phosphatidylglycerophosphate/cardiolipin synthase family protein (plasmid) [Rhodococcus sp. USK10]|uniref:phosphatidylserine/phosphatidylglycerophosphate/ cardiolipin synthase family protein n=1 Tax=Rhodococcus sp. USK10 TaxID=2789739 RepID=UPI001C60603C|nr:phosphatidylserine/phosphatidylglycerophosphate/cardiolipin synthase family protein [Rhodococcus sp. USK10]QYA99737.1 phosphatidylserine/phosphatidylglycerophosphate/cardiolipin synthase family protein [Rhodococcus sp. USK10]